MEKDGFTYDSAGFTKGFETHLEHLEYNKEEDGFIYDSARRAKGFETPLEHLEYNWRRMVLYMIRLGLLNGLKPF